MRRNLLVALIGVLVVAGAAVAVVLVVTGDDETTTAAPTPTASRTASPSPSPSPSPTPTPTPSPSRRVSPLTGLPRGLGKPVLAVKIDNVGPARPPTGLARADLVYIEPVEAGLSRILAVFSSRPPSVVGPVRSARESDLELLRQYGRPAFAFSGAQTKLLPLIARAPLFDVSPAGAASAYFRGASRPAPHNLYARPSGLLGQAPRASRARDIGFRFGSAPRGGRATASRTVRYSAFRVGFTWSARRDRWSVAMDGTPIGSADGTVAAPSTVVVQYVTIRPSRFHDKFGNTSPRVETVGSGRALVLRNGRSYDARWSRPSAADGTRFTTSTGEPMTFDPGQVWVVFAPR